MLILPGLVLYVCVPVEFLITSARSERYPAAVAGGPNWSYMFATSPLPVSPMKFAGFAPAVVISVVTVCTDVGLVTLFGSSYTPKAGLYGIAEPSPQLFASLPLITILAEFGGLKFGDGPPSTSAPLTRFSGMKVRAVSISAVATAPPGARARAVSRKTCESRFVAEGSTATACAPVPAASPIVTNGLAWYPEPGSVIVKPLMCVVGATLATAVAPVPKPSARVSVTFGTTVYPPPGTVIVIAVTRPGVPDEDPSVAVAVGFAPALGVWKVRVGAVE